MKDISTPYGERPLHRQTIPTVISNRAEAIGDDVFAYYGHTDEAVTYSQLEDSTNQIAHSCLESGVDAGDYVGVMMKNALRTVESMYGIIKSGGVYAPIDWHYKGNPLTHQLNDTNPAVLIIDDQFVERLNKISDDIDESPHLIVRETDHESERPQSEFSWTTYREWLVENSSEVPVERNWDDPACLVYTSGTTGFPKGAILSHRFVLANFSGYVSQFHNEDDVFHAPVPLYHVGGLGYAVTSMLLCGGSVALWDRFSTSEFWDRIEKYNATSTILLGVMIDWLQKSDFSDDVSDSTLYKADIQPLPEDIDVFTERFGIDLVTTSFGQTESGLSIVGGLRPNPDTTITPEENIHGKHPDEIETVMERMGVPVLPEPPGDRWLGQPRESLFEVAILDEHDEKVATGESGEIAIRPKTPNTIFQQYHSDAEKTVETLANLWYHTGDIGRQDEDGHLYFIDRDHFLIRRRGENISSRHLEETVNKFPPVSRSAVFPVPAKMGDEDEIAMVVQLVPDEATSSEEIRDFLLSHLPEFMVPTQIKIRNDMPTTETNKIQKSQLRNSLIEDLDRDSF